MSHFSLGSGGGVPAMGCGRGRVAVPVFAMFAVLTLFALLIDGRDATSYREMLNNFFF